MELVQYIVIIDNEIGYLQVNSLPLFVAFLCRGISGLCCHTLTGSLENQLDASSPLIEQ